MAARTRQMRDSLCQSLCDPIASKNACCFPNRNQKKERSTSELSPDRQILEFTLDIAELCATNTRSLDKKLGTESVFFIFRNCLQERKQNKGLALKPLHRVYVERIYDTGTSILQKRIRPRREKTLFLVFQNIPLFHRLRDGYQFSSVRTQILIFSVCFIR